jgi:hypothetical protein
MTPLFRPGANLVTTLILLLVGGGAVLVYFTGWLVPFTEWVSGVRYPIEQPVPFSHLHHVSGLGLDCRFCHSTVEVAASAGMPPTHTCMTCHAQLWTNAAVLEPVRHSFAADVPLHWQRINRLPDYVYFNHSIHVAKGIGCVTCHGRIDEMALTSKEQSLRMSWCIDCHRDPSPNLRPKNAIFDLAWRRSAETPSGAALARQYHVHTGDLTDCSVCHR